MSESTSLLDRINELIDSGSLDLPVFSGAALKLQALSADPDFDPAEVEKLIMADQVLAAEVLRAANSSFFGGLKEIHTVGSAVVRLGIRQVCRLVLLASHRSTYDARDLELRHKIQGLWQHASVTATASQWLVHKLGFGKLEDEAFLAGLLHDVGQLVVMRAIDRIKLSEKAAFNWSSHLVDEILQTAHAELGFNLLKRWGIPEVYCRIARDHHLADFDPSNIVLIAVRLANHAGAKIGLSLEPDPTLVLSSLPEALCLGAGEILLAELEIMMEDALAPESCDAPVRNGR